tara:strand:+ start:1063 stop:1221 length:159 start_codon:yes stop_codon:yes gene_type:complete
MSNEKENNEKDQNNNPFKVDEWASVIFDLYNMAYNRGYQDAIKKLNKSLKKL